MTLAAKDRSINQTNADFIKDLPLIASFELKRQALGTDPLVQLSIWSAALAERLGKLQGQGEKESALMAIPVVSIVGHHWNVYYSYTTGEGERVRFRFLIIKSTIACDRRCKCWQWCYCHIDVTRAGCSGIDNGFCGHLQHYESDSNDCEIWGRNIHAMVWAIHLGLRRFNDGYRSFTAVFLVVMVLVNCPRPARRTWGEEHYGLAAIDQAPLAFLRLIFFTIDSYGGMNECLYATRILSLRSASWKPLSKTWGSRATPWILLPSRTSVISPDPYNFCSLRTFMQVSHRYVDIVTVDILHYWHLRRKE